MKTKIVLSILNSRMRGSCAKIRRIKLGLTMRIHIVNKKLLMYEHN